MLTTSAPVGATPAEALQYCLDRLPVPPITLPSNSPWRGALDLLVDADGSATEVEELEGRLEDAEEAAFDQGIRADGAVAERDEARRKLRELRAAALLLERWTGPEESARLTTQQRACLDTLLRLARGADA